MKPANLIDGRWLVQLRDYHDIQLLHFVNGDITIHTRLAYEGPISGIWEVGFTSEDYSIWPRVVSGPYEGLKLIIAENNITESPEVIERILCEIVRLFAEDDTDNQENAEIKVEVPIYPVYLVPVQNKKNLHEVRLRTPVTNLWDKSDDRSVGFFGYDNDDIFSYCTGQDRKFFDKRLDAIIHLFECNPVVSKLMAEYVLQLEDVLSTLRNR